MFIVHQFKEIETQVLFDKFSRQVKSSTWYFYSNLKIYQNPQGIFT